MFRFTTRKYDDQNMQLLDQNLIIDGHVMRANDFVASLEYLPFYFRQTHFWLLYVEYNYNLAH